MEPKKNPKVDLRNYTAVFVLLGLLFAMSTVLMAFEWRKYEYKEVTGYNTGPVEDDIEEIPPIPEEEIQPPPPPKQQVQEIEIPEEEEEEEEEWEEIDDTEFDEEEVIEQNFEEEEEEVEEEPKIFVIVEDMPAFPGCEKSPKNQVKMCTDQKIHTFLAKNIRYPEMAKEANISGKVFIYFEVAPSGSVENVKVLKGPHKLLEEEAKRVVRNFPKFRPGKQRGKAVRVSFRIPVNFVLSN